MGKLQWLGDVFFRDFSSVNTRMYKVGPQLVVNGVIKSL